MNYDRIKFLFVELYKEFSTTFDSFETDFAEAINRPIVQKQNIAVIRDMQDEFVKYFEEITASSEAVEAFIREQLAPAVKARQKFDVSSSYHYVLAKVLKTSNIEIGRNINVNYAAFKRKLLNSFEIAQKDLHKLIRIAIEEN